MHLGRADASVLPLLQSSGVSRSFGDTKALTSCTFDIRDHEIHALLGENGSGKSTMVKILSGVIARDSGTIEFRGRPLHFRTPAEAQEQGVSTVFQETLVADTLSVLDNIMVGTDGIFRRRAWAGSIDTGNIVQLLDRLGIRGGSLDRPVWQLPLAERQIVTIVRALVRPWRLLILDEATSALDVEQRDRFFECLEEQRQHVGGILFISHRMDEITRMADRVTVLRSGASIETLNASSASVDVLVRLMSGGNVASADATEIGVGPIGASRPSGDLGSPLIAADRIVLRPGAVPFDLEVGAGDIIGIAGLEGHGQARFVECLAGLARPHAGSVSLFLEPGHSAVQIDGLHDAFAHGVVYVPRDRKREGLFLPQSVTDNITISVLQRFSRFGFLRRSRLARLVEGLIDRVEIRAPSVRVPVTELSGGNQQKVLLARSISGKPRALILNDPLRGVDHNTKSDLYKSFVQLSKEGVAIVFLSTEIEELVHLCPKVAVFRDHALFTTLEGDSVSRDAIVSASFGQTVV